MSLALLLDALVLELFAPDRLHEVLIVYTTCFLVSVSPFCESLEYLASDRVLLWIARWFQMLVNEPLQPVVAITPSVCCLRHVLWMVQPFPPPRGDTRETPVENARPLLFKEDIVPCMCASIPLSLDRLQAEANSLD